MRTLSILAPTRYPWRFNSPRNSRHRIEQRNFLPLNKLSDSLEGITVINPLPLRRFDLVHGFNRIPAGRLPFVIGFESHLPRGFGIEAGGYFAWLRTMLAGDRCRRIIAISEYARRIFVDQHAGTPEADALFSKLCVRFPNMSIDKRAPTPVAMRPDEPIRLVFVGAHFGRKGGCVAVKIAEKSLQLGVPIQVHIVSALEVGGSIWTDPPDPAFFKPYLSLLNLPNVRLHRALPNSAVIDLLRGAHFSLLTTFCDTFGYSAFESLAQSTPVLATRQGALPEFIRNGENGILLDLETQPSGDWIHSDSSQRKTPAFARLFADEVERLSAEALARIVEYRAKPSLYALMREAAGRSAIRHFDAGAASAFWDQLYVDALEP